MLDHEIRVVDEKFDLDVKLNALTMFMETPVFKALPNVDRTLLSQQWTAMTTYSRILGQRIERFTR